MLEEPSCSKRKCIHFLGVMNGGDESTERNYCEAFPDGIPRFIAYGKNRHDRHIKGDHGIKFEKA
jgi:hypothetical protein